MRRKNLKKIVSVILVLSLLLVSNFEACALSNSNFHENSLSEYLSENQVSTNEDEDYLVLEDKGTGEVNFISKFKNSAKAKNLINKFKNNRLLLAKKIDEQGIYEINNGEKYAIDSGKNQFILTEKVNIDVDEFNKYDEIYNEYEIPQILLEKIEKTIEEQKEMENDSLKVELYVPETLENEYQVNLKGETCLKSTKSNPSPSYYTKYGIKFKDTFVKFKNEKVSQRIVGSTSKNSAAAFKNFLISLGGTVGPFNTVVSAFSTGLSALSIYQSKYGYVSKGNGDDEIYTFLKYDKLIKTTTRENSVSPDNYNLGGYITYKIWLNKQITFQYYSQNGSDDTTEEYINEVITSKNFSNAAYMATKNYPNSFADDEISIKFLGASCIIQI